MAISFQGMGNEGRLGNQMFQYAFLRGVAARRGYDWIIPGPDADRLDNYGLFEAFELSGCKPENQGEPSSTNKKSIEIWPLMRRSIMSVKITLTSQVTSRRKHT